MGDNQLPTEKQPIVRITDGNFLHADSRDVAAYFGKNHQHVLEAIRNAHCSAQFRLSNFRPFKIRDLTGESTSHVLMTKDGFAFIGFGFTGKKAGAFKEAYINAFNAKDAEIRRLQAVRRAKPVVVKEHRRSRPVPHQDQPLKFDPRSDVARDLQYVFRSAAYRVEHGQAPDLAQALVGVMTDIVLSNECPIHDNGGTTLDWNGKRACEGFRKRLEAQGRLPSQRDFTLN